MLGGCKYQPARLPRQGRPLEDYEAGALHAKPEQGQHKNTAIRLANNRWALMLHLLIEYGAKDTMDYGISHILAAHQRQVIGTE